MNNEYVYERVRHLTNIAVWSIDLQAKRIDRKEPEDSQFLFRRWMDYHFLIVSMSRLRSTAEQLKSASVFKDKIEAGLNDFDKAFPWLKDLRNIVAHFDEYPIGKGFNKKIKKEDVEVAAISEKSLRWLDHEIQPEKAVRESVKLFSVIKSCDPKINEINNA